MKYRAEIDGLRALAVLPVILFHAGFEWFGGGFVGVDVFFVISGFLITSILINDIENKNFSIVGFYERRARRILPALFFVMLVCLPFAWEWMLPTQIKDFSQSLVAVSLFASNFLFWWESGYFSAAAEEKPLLHTWSLAVEEQYYFIFPIFLALVYRFGRQKVFWLISFFALTSLFFSEWASRNHASANFYMAPTRVWEILAGSLSAFIVKKYGVQKNNTLSCIGLIMIMFAIFVYDEQTPFPGFYALVPVIGVVCIVLFASKDTLVANFLSSKVLVGIGLISYSAYLWHQPLFAFARIRMLEDPAPAFMLLLSCFSLLLGLLSWKYIEKPFRGKSGAGFSRFQIFTMTFISASLIVAIGVTGHKSNGFIDSAKWDSIRFINSVKSQTASGFRHCQENMVQSSFSKNKVCVIGSLDAQPTGLLWGDSYAASALFGLNQALIQAEVSYYAVLNDGCPPMPGISRKNNEYNCWFDSQQEVLDAFNASEELTDLIWVGRFRELSNPNVENGFFLNQMLPSLEKTQDIIRDVVRELIKHNKKAVFVLEGANFDRNIPEYLMQLSLFNEPADEIILSRTLASQQDSVGLSKDYLDTLKGIGYVDSLELFCESNLCNAVMGSGSPLVVDEGHISHEASILLAQEIMRQLEGLKN
jgi:peptidoglycan/LPS O-acetylase OafA/YrhL